MRELLQVFGIVRPKEPPQFVRAFDAATERLTHEMKERGDAFSDMMDNMAGRPGRKARKAKCEKPATKRGG